MKNILIVVLIILVVALASTLGYVMLAKKSSSTLIAITTPKTLSEIATQLVADYYLKPALSTIKNDQDRILDYKVTRIEVGNDEDTCFRFHADFSVKPAVANTAWLAGNGKMNSDGWVDTNLGFDATKQADGSYVLEQGFTGAPSASCKK